MTPLFTVGIPVHNGMPFLPETMESVLKQSYEDFDILVIDDGSSDKSVKYLSSLRDPRICLISQPNQKLTATLNRMLAESRTPWLVRMDADDIAAPSRLAVIAESIKKSPQAGMFYSRARHHNHGNSISLVRSTEGTPAELRALVESGYLPSICHSSVVLNVRKTLELGGYRFNLHVEDLDLWWRMALSHEIVFVPEVTVAYRLNNSSVSINNLRELSCNTLYVQYLLFSHLRNLPSRPYSEIKPQLQNLVNGRGLRYREQMWQAAICLSNEHTLRALGHMTVAATNAPLRFLRRCSYPLWRNSAIRVGESPRIFARATAELWPSTDLTAGTIPAMDM